MPEIYGLIDKGRCRYVGYTGDRQQRLRGHLRDKAKTPKTEWLASLSEPPKIVPIFEWSDDEDAPGLKFLLERIFVTAMRDDGFDLTNSNDGGGGCLAHTSETRARLSVAGKGRLVSSETIAKLSLSLTGHAVSQETRDKISKANKGRTAHNKGSGRPKRRESPDERKLRFALHNTSPEMRELSRRNGAKNLGRKHTPTAIAVKNMTNARRVGSVDSLEGNFIPDSLVPVFFEWLGLQ